MLDRELRQAYIVPPRGKGLRLNPRVAREDRLAALIGLKHDGETCGSTVLQIYQPGIRSGANSHHVTGFGQASRFLHRFKRVRGVSVVTIAAGGDIDCVFTRSGAWRDLGVRRAVLTANGRDLSLRRA